MKKLFTIFILVIFSGVNCALAQTDLEVLSQGISQTYINVRGNPVAVGQLTINALTAGKVVVHFNGACLPSFGDRIILAASDQVDWGVNDGNVSVLNYEGNFSHVRVYDVTPGNHTFYAVAQNYVDEGGTGLVSIYASLTVEFFPNTNTAFVLHTGIDQTYINVRGNPVAVGQLTINAPTAGKVLVHFNGACIPSFGDRIVLAASDQVDWGVNDGNVSVLNYEGSFSHIRVYDVTPGNHTFYAVAQNYVDEGGTGLASIYASLTVEFFPNTNPAFVSHTGIIQTYINVRGNPVAVGQLTINAPAAGKVLVHFNGICIPSFGDRIILAASDQVNWGVNDGNVSVLNYEGLFSHIRIYDVTPGNHTFYAVAQNFVNEGGTGLASIYASLTVEFFPDVSTSVENSLNENFVLIYPNPANDKLFIEFSNYKNTKGEIINAEGQLLQNFSLQDLKTQINIGNLAKGMYTVKIITDKGLIVKKIIKQ